jgi:hypothetical protein
MNAWPDPKVILLAAGVVPFPWLVRTAPAKAIRAVRFFSRIRRDRTAGQRTVRIGRIGFSVGLPADRFAVEFEIR